ncbi:MAG: tilS [Rickettsiaceae bacterium]|jgi:tRNA(Ile)-lysidine synthase|nr:tilS [Rickettsiaceae bacterium]
MNSQVNASLNLHQAFSDTLEKFSISGNIAIAVSGGADSMAMALLSAKWAEKNSCKVIALTVDHDLRPESADEAAQVKKWFSCYNIPHHTLKWEGDKKSSNIQSEARDARYRLMTEFCHQNSIPTLLIAHNKEDQAETVLLRLMRGSGVDGLCGMEDEIIHNGIRLLRPLLTIEKNQLRQFLKEQNQEWVEDPSNQNTKYARVNVRKFIETSGEPELLVNRLVETTTNMQRSRNYIEHMIIQDMANVASFQPEGYCIIDIDTFRKLHEESAYRILAKTIKQIGGEYYKPRFEKLQNLYENLVSNKFTDCTLGGCNIYQSKKQNEIKKIFVIREQSAVQNDITIHPNTELIWDNRFICNLSSTTNNSQVGAIGESGWQQIADKVTTNLPKRVIFSLPALKNLEIIVAAPHIGYCLDNEFNGEFVASFKANL